MKINEGIVISTSDTSINLKGTILSLCIRLSIKSCPIYVQRQLTTIPLSSGHQKKKLSCLCPKTTPGQEFEKSTKIKLSYLCPRTQTDHIWKFCEKLSYLCPRTQTNHIWNFCEKLSYLCPRTQTDHIWKFCEKLSYLCPRTQTDHIWKVVQILRKVVLFVSQDTNRPHLEILRKVVLFMSQDNIGTHFIFLPRRDSKDNSSQLIHYLHSEKVVQHCPRTTFVYIMIYSRLLCRRL